MPCILRELESSTIMRFNLSSIHGLVTIAAVICCFLVVRNIFYGLTFGSHTISDKYHKLSMDVWVKQELSKDVNQERERERE